MIVFYFIKTIRKNARYAKHILEVNNINLISLSSLPIARMFNPQITIQHRQLMNLNNRWESSIEQICV